MLDKVKGKNLNEAGADADALRKVVAEVVHAGSQMILPEGCSLEEGIDLLQRRMAYMNEVVNIAETIDVSPLDGAHALDRVLAARYGWSEVGATPGWFGSTPPTLVAVEVSRGKRVNVPFGRFTMPTIKGHLEIGGEIQNGRVQFAVKAQIRRESEQEVMELLAELRAFLVNGSIYRGQAVRVRFLKDNGDVLPLPDIRYIDTDVDERTLIYSRDVEAMIHTNLFTPLLRLRELEANGITFRRGVLLGGTYGTGKTLAAKVASKYAVQAGVTYLYVPRADELKQAIEFARQYQSPGCVIFCEDVDRVTKGERSVAMDDLLNIIDGIDGKNDRIMVVLTTNDLQNIHPAMLRPGRLDAVIEVTAPDADAVERLLRSYGGDSIVGFEDLSEAGAILAGEIPATIAEVVKRAKLAQIGLQPVGEPVGHISGRALAIAATTMSRQLALLKTDRNPPREPTMREVIEGAVRRELAPTAKLVHELADNEGLI